MKKIFFTTVFLAISLATFSQAAITVKLPEDLSGICDKNKIYYMMSLDDQKEAVCPVTIDEILERLSSEVLFINANPTYQDELIVSIIISCNGIVVQVKCTSPHIELNDQIISVFSSLGSWEAAKLFDENVDSMFLYTVNIENGEISINH